MARKKKLAVPRYVGGFGFSMPLVITDDDISNWFSYHKPTKDQIPKYNLIRDAARVMAKVIVANTPPGADQTATMRALRQTVMMANQAIACHRPTTRVEVRCVEASRAKLRRAFSGKGR